MATFNTINGCNVMSNANGSHANNLKADDGNTNGVKTDANGIKVIPIPSNANGNHANNLKADDGNANNIRGSKKNQ
ncbi:hypothetical protein BKH42_04095 [Helicobacter sp. 13S00482-2]|uniref:hypothetical protein n=1 Tax=Helicobacter sp. 13S00482-2 TaxID=1476200 RepID=UPI000BA7A4FD|nr:hypothetical protein [Helicobacter sp. 13S00482-2]PAF53686.1 hypothetical protein BKH42_04095 [Helicobacter sp. 13S00482-2]